MPFVLARRREPRGRALRARSHRANGSSCSAVEEGLSLGEVFRQDQGVIHVLRTPTLAFPLVDIAEPFVEAAGRGDVAERDRRARGGAEREEVVGFLAENAPRRG